LSLRRNVDGNTALALRNPQLAYVFPRVKAARTLWAKAEA